jgi:hypothetical protein
MASIFDYESIRRGSESCNDAPDRPNAEHKTYLVHCYCRGQIISSNLCSCFGTAKFFGPDRR